MNDSNKRVWLLSDPFESLSIRLYLIKNAKKSIKVQTFIWGEDDVSFLILNELTNAARRGVKVQILLDGWVGVDFPNLILALDAASPLIESKHYNPPTRVVCPSIVRLIRAISVNAKRLNHRMHSKMFNVDEKWSILGGRNYESKYFGINEKKFFRDREILTYKKRFTEADKAFNEFWNHRLSIPTQKLSFTYYKEEKNENFIKKHTKVGIENKPKATDSSKSLKNFLEWNDTFKCYSWLNKNKFRPKSYKLIYDVPGKIEDKVSQSASKMLKAIASTEEELILQTPYLVFGDKTLKLLKEVSLKPSKPFFKFVTNSYASNDNILAHILGAKDRHNLRKLGNIKIFEYLKFPRVRIKNEPKKTSICDHSKTIIIDSKLTYIGSSNFDPRSNNLNSEIGIIIEDQQFASAVKVDINSSLVDGNYFLESDVLDGIDKLTYMNHLRNFYLTICIEPNLPSIGRIIFYPFQYIIPRYFKRYF